MRGRKVKIAHAKLDQIEAELKDRGKVEIPKLGVFELKKRSGNPNNPHIDEPDEYNVITFRPSGVIKDKIRNL